MWTSKPTDWVEELFPLEKFFTERVIQRCDSNESITNQHRTTNGYIQIKELVYFSNLSLKRGRTIRTVKLLLEEAKSDLFSQNVKNDVIIREYFTDLRKFIDAYDSSKLILENTLPNLFELNNFIHKLRVYESQLEKNYLITLLKEFRKIEYKETVKIERQAKKIAELVDILIPYLAFKGYAISSISELLHSWIGKKYKATFSRTFPYFNFKLRSYEYLIELPPDKLKDEWKVFLAFLQEDQKVELTVGKIKKIKGQYPQLSHFGETKKVVIYRHNDLDPHVHFRYI